MGGTSSLIACVPPVEFHAEACHARATPAFTTTRRHDGATTYSVGPRPARAALRAVDEGESPEIQATRDPEVA